MKSKWLSVAVLCGAFITQRAFAQAHGHLNIGAVSTTQGAQLIFDNGPDFEAASRYVKTLEFTNAGKYAGYYQQNITLTVLPATSAFGGPTAKAPAPGSQIAARISVLSAPPGGSFGFWDTNSTTAPSISLTNGEIASNLFHVSQTGGVPGVDPFGHIHGRRFTATHPGLYLIGFQAFDVCTNGAAGGPIHTPSELLTVWFQAGITLMPVTLQDGATRIATITYGSVTHRIGIVEYSTNLSPATWIPFATNAGTDLFQTVTNVPAFGPRRFYRVRVTMP